MAELTAGNVVIQITGNVAPFEQAMARARDMAGQFDRSVSGTGATQFAKAVAPAAAATERLSKVAAPATTALATLGSTATAGANQVARHTKAVNDNATAHAGLSTQAQAAFHSVRGFTEMVMQGVPISQAAAREFNNLSYAASGPGGLTGAMGQALGMFTRMLSPTTLLIGSVVALGAGALLAVNSWKSFALTLDDTAHRAAITSSAMAKLQAAAGFKGISQEDFAKGSNSFADQIYQAQHNMGSAATVFRANGLSVPTDYTTGLQKAADLIQNAGTYQQKLVLLQQLGLPATDQWVRLLQNGSAGLKAATDQAAAFGGAANDNMVAKAREFDEAWNKALTNFGLEWRNAGLDILNIFQQIGNSEVFKIISKVAGVEASIVGAVASAYVAPLKLAGQGINAAAGYFNGRPASAALSNQNGGQAVAFRFPTSDQTFRPTPTSSAKPTVDPQVLQHQLQLEQQRISILGSLATAQDAARASEIAVQQARLAGVKITNDEGAALQRLAFQQAEAGKLQRQNQFGIFDPLREQANAARQIGTLIDDKTITSVNQYASAWVVVSKNLQNASDAAAAAGSKFEQLTRYSLDAQNITKNLDQITTSGFSSFENAFGSFVSGAQTAQQAFHNFAQSVISDIAKMVVRQTITGPLAASLSGFLGSTFGGAPALGAAGQGGYSQIDSLFGFTGGKATGGYIAGPGGPTTDSIPTMLSNGEFVINAAQTAKHLALLHAINQGSIRHFADGGIVGPGGAGYSMTPQAVQVHIHDQSGGVQVQQRSQSKGGGIDVFVPSLEAIMAKRARKGQGQLAPMLDPASMSRSRSG